MKTYTFSITVTSTVYRTLSVELEDGLTEEQVEERLDAAIEKEDLAYDLERLAEIEIDRWPEYIYGEPDLSPLPIPDDAWVGWRGRRWATNGVTLVRDDCPPVNRLSATEEWYSPAHRYGPMTPEKLDKLMVDLGKPMASDPMLRKELAPIVAAPARVVTHGEFGPVECYDTEGALYAIVCPVRSDEADNVARLSVMRGTP